MCNLHAGAISKGEQEILLLDYLKKFLKHFSDTQYFSINKPGGWVDLLLLLLLLPNATNTVIASF